MRRATVLKDIPKVFRPSPLSGESFDAFHVDTSEARGDDYANKLSTFLNINIDDPQKILFMGHRGSGKSTELFKVIRNLENNFKIINFSIKKEIDATDLNYIDLVFSMLNVVFENIKADKINIPQTTLDNLISYWKSDKLIEELKVEKMTAEATLSAKISFLTAITASVKGVLSTGKESKITVRKHIEPRLSQLIKYINALLLEYKTKLKKQGKIPLIIIEDLDKLDIPIAEDLFLNHRNVLIDIDVHIIYTFPIFLHYSEKYNEIKDSFSYTELLSMIKVNDKNKVPFEPGRRLIREIIKKRAELNLFAPEALDFVIAKSGGTLRNIFEMLVKSAVKTIVIDDKATKISLEVVTSAYRELKSDYERCISHKHLETLIQLYKDPHKKPLADENLRELLYCMAVIEYNGERWCDLHPAVEDMLKDKGVLNDISC